MRTLLLTVVLLELCVFHGIAGSTCVCNRHVEKELYPCPNYNAPPVGYLYADNDDSGCILQADGVVAPPGWYAGIFTNPFVTQIVYIERDYLVSTKACTLARPNGKVSYNKQCTTLKPGATINPTKPTTTSTTTTTTTTTTSPKPTTTSTTVTTPTTTKTAPLPTGPASSQKCDRVMLETHVQAKTRVDHPAAAQCPDGSYTSKEALLFDTCNNIATDKSQWKQELRVIDNCSNIPRGEPLAFFIHGHPTAVSAVFWTCVAGQSFEIAFQECGTAVKVMDIATLNMGIDRFYTFSW